MSSRAEFIARTCIGDPQIHAVIMQEACEWVKACKYDRKKAMDSTGERGDLFFVLQAHEHEFFETQKE